MKYTIGTMHTKADGNIAGQFSTFEWTTERPAVEGWYWVYLENAEICRITMEHEFKVWRMTNETSDTLIDLCNEGAYFLGPIPKPEPPTS